MIAKNEGQGVQPTQSIAQNTPQEEPKSFIDKHKTPIIIILSSLIICIIAVIVVILVIPKPVEQGNKDASSSNENNTSQSELTENQQEAYASLKAVYDSDDPKATAAEEIPKLQAKIDDPETPVADKVAYILSASNIYVRDKKYGPAIVLLEETLQNDPYLTNLQRVNLLYKLDSIYFMGKVYDKEIEVIQQILDTPADEDYSVEDKERIDQKYSEKLEKIKQQKENSKNDCAP